MASFASLRMTPGVLTPARPSPTVDLPAGRKSTPGESRGRKATGPDIEIPRSPSCSGQLGACVFSGFGRFNGRGEYGSTCHRPLPGVPAPGADEEGRCPARAGDRADLPGIRVSAAVSPWLGRRGKGEVFFCTMGPIRVRRVTIAGDGRPLPQEAVVQGLNVAEDGTYDVLNALVRSNGNLHVIVDEVSQVVPRPRSREYSGSID